MLRKFDKTNLYFVVWYKVPSLLHFFCTTWRTNLERMKTVQKWAGIDCDAAVQTTEDDHHKLAL